jgi:hypothetical protein
LIARKLLAVALVGASIVSGFVGGVAATTFDFAAWWNPPDDPAEFDAPELTAERYRRDHEAQDVDAEWAESAAASFRLDLERRAEARGRLEALECRTTSCAVTLEWPTYGEAHAEFMRLVEGQYALNCATRMSVPPPADDAMEQPYRAVLYFDCAEVRAHAG